MTARTRWLTAARRRARRDEGGYLLIYVMAIIGLTSVVVIAILGLVLTSARVARMEAQLAREHRAADGALEAQIAEIASRGGEVCDSLEARVVEGSSVSPDVEVECTASPVADNEQDTADGPDVEIVGTTPYQGAVAASDGNLVVRGTDGAARFQSDVNVRRGADVDRADGQAPGVSVTGQYLQGAEVDGGGCGPLAEAGPHQIADAGGQGSPTCGVEPAIEAATRIDVSGVGPPSMPRDISCAPGGTVTLTPGTYNSTEIQQLNAILGGTVDCTVVFAPGIHHLDVADKSRTGAARSVLSITNPNVKVIGGEPSGEPFPRACRTGAGAPGVQLVLSPRSAIRHEAGQVALCPAHDTGSGPDVGPLPVISQSANANTQPELESVSSADFSPAENLATGSSQMATATVCSWDTGNWTLPLWCANRSFDTTWLSSGSGPLTSARMLIDMHTVPLHLWNAGWPSYAWYVSRDTPAAFHAVDLRVTFTVTKGGFSCSTDAMPAGRTQNATTSFDLTTSGSCASTLNQQQQLDGATIRTTFSVAGGAQGLLIDARNVRLETNSARLVASGASSSHWNDPGNATNADNASAVVEQPGTGAPVTVWESSGRVTRTIEVTGFSLASTDLQPTDVVSRLAVVVRGPTNENEPSFLADPIDGGSTRLTLTTGDGQSCVATSPIYGQSKAHVRYDLISSGCAGLVNTVGQLEGARIELSITSGCAVPVVIIGSSCASVQMPKVDQIAIDVGTDTYHGVSPYSSVSVDVANGTSFDVFGPVDMPTADLDIRWVGTTYARPLFAGRLHVHGLGVQQLGPVQGVVCCVLNEQGATLVARVGSEIRAQADVRVDAARNGTPTARRPVEVLSWKLCNRVTC